MNKSLLSELAGLHNKPEAIKYQYGTAGFRTV
jgi:hypothetical protein